MAKTGTKTKEKAEAKRKKSGIVIDQERCKGCYLCIHVCPKENIKISGKLNAKGYHPAEFDGADTCTGCAVCMLVCPDLAIEVYDED